MSNKSIVIVEDENLVARDLQTSLEQLGYTEDSMVPSGEQTKPILQAFAQLP